MMPHLFKALNVSSNGSTLSELAAKVGVSRGYLKHIDKTGKIPPEDVLTKLAAEAGMAVDALKLRMGVFDDALLSKIQNNADEIAALVADDRTALKSKKPSPELMFATDLGRLYQGDCLNLLSETPAESFDLIFADPPFNLRKLYPSNIDDDLRQDQYLRWTNKWLDECIRALAEGGSLFMWNLPQWNAYFSSYLNKRLTFRHWIAVDIKYSLPISGRLYPSHYSLLYYVKGPKPKTFHPDRLPMPVCPNCVEDLRDYGGYKDKMNPKGVNISDVWTDISPLRHAKYKKRKSANELPLRLLDRIIEMASEPGDQIFDPFGGAGTTYVVAELKGRRWTGIEIGPVDVIVDRFNQIEKDNDYLENIRKGYNSLFTAETETKRKRKGLWTCDSFGPKNEVSSSH